MQCGRSKPSVGEVNSVWEKYNSVWKNYNSVSVGLTRSKPATEITTPWSRPITNHLEHLFSFQSQSHSLSNASIQLKCTKQEGDLGYSSCQQTMHSQTLFHYYLSCCIAGSYVTNQAVNVVEIHQRSWFLSPPCKHTLLVVCVHAV